MWGLNFAGQRADQSHTMRTSNGSPLYSNYFGQSSFSSLAIVNRRCLVKVPDDTPLELYAPLGCGMQTGAGAIFNTLDVQPGETVAVFGTGSVGMAVIMAAKIRNAGIIIGIDINPKRLEIAKQLGATHVLDGPLDDISLCIREICRGGGVKSAIDTTGSAVVIEQMISSLGILGKAVTIGAPAPGTQVHVDVISHLTMGRQYIGCNQGDSIPEKVFWIASVCDQRANPDLQMIPYLIEQHSQGKFPLEQIVTHYQVDEYALALRDMELGDTIKPVLLWRSPSTNTQG